jgi:uncharacterized protein with NAD-binding domain and iron-sulfur cluster
MAKTRVVILGGGIGGLTAAYELSRTQALRDRYDVCVYQLGWRLGGKGASGRDPRPQYGARILEHGLHIWGGFYENAFAMMREIYGALGRAPGTRLSVWYDPNDRAASAFWPQDHVTFEERVRGAWMHWPIEMPRTDTLPGDGGVLHPDAWTVARTMLEFTAHLLRETLAEHVERRLGFVERLLEGAPEPPGVVPKRLAGAIAQSARRAAAGEGIARGLTRAKHGARRRRVEDEPGIVGSLGAFLSSLVGSITGSSADGREHASDGPLGVMLDRLHDWLAELLDDIGLDDVLRRVWIVADLSLATARGILTDDVVSKGFEAINDRDWSDWLERHGASEITLDSAFVRGIYDYCFAYEGGETDRARRRLEAGTAVHGIWRLLFTYRGSLFWEMQAAMGECIFTPLYELLSKRGVRFEMFHRVDRLGLDAERSAVEIVELGVQATLRRPEEGYRPLVRVGDIDAWPDRPLYDQLVEGEALERRAIDLESAWTDWQDVARKILRRGRDFDVVVLGISLGGLAGPCRELAAASEPWRAMLEGVKVVQTQALQLWLRPTAAELGWTEPPTVLTAYAQPFNTWADLSYLGAVERWPAGAVGSVAYSCGPLRTMQPGGDPLRFPAEVSAAVRAQAADWLRANAGHLWPLGAPAGAPDGLDASLLCDPEERQGEARLDAQYWRGNVNPSDTYVLSVPGSGALRLAPGEAGFTNVVVAGDWVRTAINAGCIEAAVMGGMAAARAVTGAPRYIYGEYEWRALGAGRPRALERPPKPAYIEHGGTQVFRQPLVLRGAELRGFVLDADIGALGRLCERMLNVPAGGRARFVPLLPKALLVFAAMDAAASADTEQARWGFVSEIDVAFWVPVAVLEREGEVWEVVDLAWYLPYVFVDNPWAMATGREIYGFHKELGRFTIPRSNDGTGAFSVSTLVLDPFDPRTVASERPLFEVQRLDQGATGLRRRWDDARDALGELFGGVAGLAGEITEHLDEDVDVLELTTNLFNFVSSASVPMVFLKQFRDAADPTRACYQRVVSARAQVEPGTVRDAGPLWGDWKLRLARYASHPIATDLGLGAGDPRIDVAFRVDFSFTMQPGVEL